MNSRPEGSTLANPRSQRVRAIRALSGRSVRERTGKYLIEGPQCVRQAVQFAALDEVVVTREAAQRYSKIVATAAERGLRVRYATDEVLEHISGDSQGICAVGVQAETSLDEVFSSQPHIVAVLHEARDPGNAGTVIRAADAAGADAVVLTTGSVDVYNPKVVRSTVGSIFHLPVVTGVSFDQVMGAARTAGLKTLAADGQGERSIEDLRSDSFPAAWIFGNEAHGLDSRVLAEVDDVVRVPIYGKAESLNLAMAATLCLYASARVVKTSQA